MFSHFSRTPTCDGRTDRQTHDHGIYRESRARAVMIILQLGIHRAIGLRDHAAALLGEIMTLNGL